MVRCSFFTPSTKGESMLKFLQGCISGTRGTMADGTTGSTFKKRSNLPSLLLLVLLLVLFCNYHTFREKLKHDSERNQASHRNIFCDTSDYRTDICYLWGDVRVSNITAELIDHSSHGTKIVHKIRPYTRKWEKGCMQTVSEITLTTTSLKALACNVQHSVPGVVFSTGGYSGSIFHDFADGLVPLFITSQRFKGQVIFLIKEHKSWWVRKYSRILSLLSHYPVINLDTSREVHCFPELVVGLRNHGDLQIKPAAVQRKLDGNLSMGDFQELLRAALGNESSLMQRRPPKLLLMARNDTRVLLNQNSTLELARKIGFDVEVLSPGPKTDLVEIYERVYPAQVLMGVHGAALTHFLFMKPGSVLVQIVPLGLKWPSRTYFAKSAAKAGLIYLEYRVMPSESTLVEGLGHNHTLIRNSDNALDLGWAELKRVYLENQNVRLSLSRFKRTLQAAFEHVHTM